MEKALKAAIAAGDVPADLFIIYDDMHGLWGGVTITVLGDGSMLRQSRRAGAPQAEAEQKIVGERELIELVRLLIELRAWEQLVLESLPIPDESRARLTVAVGGHSSSMWEHFNQMKENDRLMRVKNLLLTF